MARYTTRTGSTALTANATKSLWLLNPVTDKLTVVEIGVSVDANAAAAGIGFELYRVNSLGSPAGTAATFVNADETDTTSLTTTGLVVLSAEPTSVNVFKDVFEQPFGGLFVVQYPLGREFLGKAAGSRIGLRYTTPAGVSPNCRAYVEIDE